MKTCIFLLILIIVIQSVLCSAISNTTNGYTYPVCPVTFIRRKREYTRWRANQGTTPEFLVKVLDDDLTTPIIAVNIQPEKRVSEKIIVGGVIVPPPSSQNPLSEDAREYTRFVPPTTVPPTVDVKRDFPFPNLNAVDQISPIRPKGWLKDDSILHVNRHSQRDESPPASPQFLARTPLLIARQYAPVAPVAFTRRVLTVSPLTPPVVDILNNDILNPTRSSPLPDLITPTRTKSETEDIGSFQSFIDDEFAFNAYQKYTIQRTSTEIVLVNEENDLVHTTSKNLDDQRRKSISSKILDKISENDSESLYNMIFYNNDADNDISSKNDDQEPADVYDEKSKVLKVNALSDKEFETTEIVNLEIHTESENMISSDPNKGEVDNDGDETDRSVNITSVEHTEDPSATKVTSRTLKDKIREKRRPICSLLKLRPLNFNSPRTLPEIISQLKQWAEDSPVAKWVDITDGNFTSMENPIYMMIVDDPSSGQIISAKQTVMVVAGIQGRDHHAVAAALYVLYQLIERSEAHADLLTKYRFWIIPVFNPDGYDYSMTFPHRREWSKNLRQTWNSCKGQESCRACLSHGLRCTTQPCYGVNLDRNFEYQWIPTEELRSEHPCGSLFAGVRQLSEPETRALTTFLHEKRAPLFAFIALKEGDVLGVMYPYSHTRKRRAFDHVYRQRASRAASAAYSISGRPFVAGQTSEFLPLYAGGIEDWVDGHLGIDNTYTIMIFRPTDSYNMKLLTERVVHEAYAAMDTLLLQSAEPLSPPPTTLVRAAAATPSAPYTSIIAVTTFTTFHCYIHINLRRQHLYIEM